MRTFDRIFTVAALALSLSLTACASGKPSAGPASPSPAGKSAQVQVTNNNWADMNVYLERAGMKVRLGTVTSMGKRVFGVPKAFLNSTGDFRLVADPIGAREVHVSQPVQVWPGQMVDFRIEDHIAISSISVWER